MTTYEAVQFRDALDLDDGEEVVAAQLTTKSHGQHIALVKRAEGVDDETYYCGVATGEDNTCGREVGGPDEACWQHED